MKATKHALHLSLAAASALLISSCASEPQPTATDSDIGQCKGANACKGAGSCATANNHCAGQNTCKGKGWLPLDKAECKARGGQFLGFRKK